MNNSRYTSPEIESFIISFLLSNPDKIINFIDAVDPNDFSVKNLAEIAKAIKKVASETNEPEVNLVLQELERVGKLNEIGGRSYIASLYNSDFSLPSEITNHLRIISEKKILRELRKIVDNSTKELDTGLKVSYEISADILQKINLLNFSNINESFVSIYEVAVKIFDYLGELRTSKNLIKGISTGYDNLDAVTSGFQKGDLTILAARPSVGKTAFALNLAWNVCENGNSVLFFALEMSSSDLVTRLLSLISGIESSKFRTPRNLHPEDLKTIQNIIETRIKNCKLTINDSGSINIDDIYWQVQKRYRNKQRYDLIIFDYLQLINSASKNQNYNRQVEVSIISRKLKQLAREVETPIIALSQLSRNVERREDKTPVLSDLRESGAIEQDADIVTFLHREDYYHKKNNQQADESVPNTKLIIAKHRNGPIGTLFFDFFPEFGRFTPAFLNSSYNKKDDVNLGFDE
ncbi:replicative DNA helicase [Mesomycoplasma dispar]|uniref:Replicative DNA helicase n=1 Tax=Mesomycoplasma dispar TaxID=86660 RepID=A0AAJ5TCV4_9BACT|nr:replicative DNA helicase [Mesomycoplasma dispar]AJR12473.1 DNA helicase [Mesomycoplasma dispar]ATP59993.1 replicative DNA helicase [Mesomycoplasma dispar]VEU62691.1 replicative DNA helicase [Mesomycoplasma dispar]